MDPKNDLDLPESDFFSAPPKISFEDAVELCERTLAWEIQRPGFFEKRLERMCHEEFVM